MQGIAVRISLLAVALGLAALAAGGCGSSGDAPAGATTMSFQLTDAGCEPHDAKAPAGPVVFEVENAGSSKVSEFEVLDGDTILGEKENLSEGFNGSFSLDLEAGEYTLYCPGGAAERGTLTVTGEAAAKATGPEGEAAVSDYRAYLEKNTGELVAATEPFVAAVEAGDLAEAKRLYPAARIPYERIEPVAESFGDLDPRIDARANELLGEVSASKITGEEERYSHTDLVDFEANVEGAEAAFEAVKPRLDRAVGRRSCRTTRRRCAYAGRP